MCCFLKCQILDLVQHMKINWVEFCLSRLSKKKNKKQTNIWVLNFPTGIKVLLILIWGKINHFKKSDFMPFCLLWQHRLRVRGLHVAPNWSRGEIAAWFLMFNHFWLKVLKVCLDLLCTSTGGHFADSARIPVKPATMLGESSNNDTSCNKWINSK